MSSKKHLLASVIDDRRAGVSLLELSKKYGIAKSTLSLWCRDLKLSAVVREKIKRRWLQNTAPARAKGVLKNKQKRLDSIELEYIKAKKTINKVNPRDLLIMGVGLYWAEGSKKETGSGFSFINSDCLMIKLVYEWLTRILCIKEDQLIINLVINEGHRTRELSVLKFWSNLLKLPIGSFGNTTFIKNPYRRKYDNHPNYFGMLRIKVRSSAWLRRRILGMIKVFVEEMPV